MSYQCLYCPKHPKFDSSEKNDGNMDEIYQKIKNIVPFECYSLVCTGVYETSNMEREYEYTYVKINHQLLPEKYEPNIYNFSFIPEFHQPSGTYMKF
jgi:hypothetical protein